MARVQIEIQTGYASPWSGEFDKDSITIGRSPSADVRLHPTKDTASAREVHAVIEREDDAWRLTARHDSGVTIVDRSGKALRRLEAGESHTVGPELTFELGRGGPRIGVSTVGEVLPETERRDTGGKVPLPVGRVSGEVVARANRAPRMIAATAAVLLLVSGGLGFWIFGVRGQQQITQQQTEIIQRETEEIRREAREGLERLRTSLAEGTELTSSQLEALRESVTELREQPGDRMAQVLVEASDSVWRVGVYDPESGAYEHGGTAWTVSPGRLATNAHVAQQIDALMQQGGVVRVAFRGGRQDGMIRLSEESVIHPGYERWDTILSRQFTAMTGGRAQRFQYVNPCDVALLIPAEEADLGRPLPLAADAAVRELVGDSVGYVGFPTENIVGLPTQQRVSGRLTSQSDYVFQSGDLADQHLLHHTAVSTGGASGSPLLNERGEVVGLVSAGSVIFLGGSRIPVGINYAQRVDLLAELLAGEADERQRERHERWTNNLRRVMIAPDAMLDQLMGELMPEGGVEWVDHEHTLEATGFENGYTANVTVEPGYRYAFIAVSDDWLDVRVTFMQGAIILAQDRSPGWFGIVTAVPPISAYEGTVVVSTHAELDGEPGRIRLRVARVPVGVAGAEGGAGPRG